jgi:hypothetical protein
LVKFLVIYIIKLNFINNNIILEERANMTNIEQILSQIDKQHYTSLLKLGQLGGNLVEEVNNTINILNYNFIDKLSWIYISLQIN